MLSRNENAGGRGLIVWAGIWEAGIFLPINWRSI
jgi:hypothetical protein